MLLPVASDINVGSFSGGLPSYFVIQFCTVFLYPHSEILWV